MSDLNNEIEAYFDTVELPPKVLRQLNESIQDDLVRFEPILINIESEIDSDEWKVLGDLESLFNL